jgi:hypothetical protein
MTEDNLLAGIEYAGFPGVSIECEFAIVRFIQNGDEITLARLLSSNNRHCFLLLVNDNWVAIKSGFSSGYGGEGPAALSYILKLLEFHGAKIEEYDVAPDFLQRIDKSSLTNVDIEKLNLLSPVSPIRFYDYINMEDRARARKGDLWKNFRPVLPLSIIDARIVDLALSFMENPDQSLTNGYRRLEDIIRERTGSKEHGVSLFSEVFLGQDAKLGWKNLEPVMHFSR